ncbi:MAG: radical SAM protein [Patescibacteria group bacterium]
MAKLAEVVSLFRERTGIAEDVEITAEANPEDLTPQYCCGLFEFGVTRLSVGVQSLDDAVLATVGRKGAETTVAGLKSAFSAGFTNVNADLILGLPDEAPGGTFRALSKLLEEFPLSHASLYVLEEGAYPKTWKGRHADMDGVRAEYDRCRLLLLEKGFIHYEVSNFAKPGFESKHNWGYWNRNDVRGFGLSAASLWKGERLENATSFAGYYRGDLALKETLTEEDAKLEEALCGMRTISMPKSLVGDTSKLAEFRDLGWIEERDEKILLTSA